MRKTLLALLGAAAITGTIATPASALETREFVGRGSSDFGLELIYARHDARNQATWAGFTDCVEYDKILFPYHATVYWRCTR